VADQIKKLEDFCEGKVSCNKCLERARTNSKQRYEEENEKKLFDTTQNSILSSDLTQAVYDSLISIPEIDENLEGDLSESSIANKLIENIQAGDGYCYIYHTKTIHKKIKSVTVIYRCNCHADCIKKPQKHLDKEKQRDTTSRLNRYECDGYISIKVNIENKLAIIKISHRILHPRPENINVMNDIKEFITNNSSYIAAELYKKIVSNRITGFETLTQDQVYYWWSKANIVQYK
ncbi:4425_t:CDS:2, partial [Racocetra persica]